MTLVQLTYLVALDRYRHFGLAADACFVTQPTLSFQIQSLERELGIILFDRSSRPIQPTRAGSPVITQARAVLAEAEKLSRIAQEATGAMRGELRVGVISTLAPYLLPLVITPFAGHYPRVSLIIEELRMDQILENIDRDLLDVGLIASSPGSARFVEELLFHEPLVGYVSRHHRLFSRKEIRRKDLNPEELWLMQSGHCFRDLVLDVLQTTPASGGNIGGEVRFESGNLETLQRMVDWGSGMMLLPWLAVQGQGSSAPEQVRPFAGKAPVRTVRLVYSHVLGKQHIARALADVIRKAVEPILPVGSVLAADDAA